MVSQSSEHRARDTRASVYPSTTLGVFFRSGAVGIPARQSPDARPQAGAVWRTLTPGYDSALINGLLANKTFLASLGMTSTSHIGVMVAGLALGSIPALFPASYISDVFGRRACLACAFVIMAAGTFVQTFTLGGWKMFAGRFVLGFGAGFAQVSGPAYCAEIAHPRNRAQVAALVNTCYYIGAIAAAWTTFGATYMTRAGHWSWRLCTLLQLAIPLLCLCLLPFVPESPRWLVSQGRDADALAMLARYHANGDAHDELVTFELAQIRHALALERRARQTSWLTFVRTRGNRHRLTIVVLTAVFSQWVGNGPISYYLVLILESVGVTSPPAQTAFNGGLQVWNWIAAVSGALLCERLGRRTLFLTSTAGMCACYAIITGCSAAYTEHGNEAAGKVVLAFLYVYFGFYDMAFNGLALAYPLEILPYTLRSKGMAVLFFFMMAAGFFNAYVNPIAMEAIGWRYYIVYIGVQVFAFGAIWFLFPETKGHTLEEVAYLFDRKDGAPLPLDTPVAEKEDGRSESSRDLGRK